MKSDRHDVAPHVDLGVGMVPIVNLEWVQRMHRDRFVPGHDIEDSLATILRRRPDYVRYITPQFSRTDINFQRVATVDTSNPFIARDIPALDESFMVIRFRDVGKFGTDFPWLLSMIQGSCVSRRYTIVVPGGKTGRHRTDLYPGPEVAPGAAALTVSPGAPPGNGASRNRGRGRFSVPAQYRCGP